MSEPIPSPSPDILALPQETHIQLAIDAITKAGSKPTASCSLLAVLLISIKYLVALLVTV